MEMPTIAAAPSMSWRTPLSAAAVGLIAVGLAEIVANPVARSLVSLPLLVVPGICLLTAVLGRAARALDGVTYAALAVLGSLVLLVAQALMTTALGVRLGLRGYGAVAALALCVLAAIGSIRLLRSTQTAAPHRVPLRAVLAFAAVTVVGALAAVIAGRLLPGPVPHDYAAFSLSGSWAQVHRTVPVPKNRGIRIPFELHPNAQARTSTYRVVVQMDGRPTGPGMTHTIWHGASYYGSVGLPTPSDGCRHRVTLDGWADNGWRGQIVLFVQNPSSLGCTHA